MREYAFDAIIQKHPSLNAAFIEFPYDVEKEFGKKGQVKVLASFDGIEYRGSLVRMEYHCHLIGITQEIRQKIKKGPGDVIQVIIKADTEPRIIDIPPDMEKILSEYPEARRAYDKLSYTHQKEYVRWITEAKKEETRNNRLSKTIDLLLKGTKTPDHQK